MKLKFGVNAGIFKSTKKGLPGNLLLSVRLLSQQRGSGFRGGMEYFIGCNGFRVFPPDFSQQGGQLHRFHHIEIIGRRTTVSTQTDSDAGFTHFLKFEVHAGSQFHIGGRIMSDLHSMVCQHTDFIRIYIDTVGNQQTGRQYPTYINTGQESPRTATEFSTSPSVSARCSWIGTLCSLQSIRPLQQLTGNGIDGVRTYGEMYPFIVSVHLFIQLLNGLFTFSANSGWKWSKQALEMTARIPISSTALP